MWILYILHSTAIEEKFMYHSGQKHEQEGNKLQILLDFLISVFLLPLCGIALLISLLQGTVVQNFDNCTLKQLYCVVLCCVINLYNLLLAVTPSEACYDIPDMFIQLKMRERRNEGIFLCNCKIIKFDLKISILLSTLLFST